MYDITRVEFEMCVNTGNFENEKIRLVAEVPSQDDDQEAVVKRTIEDLRRQAIGAASINLSEAVRRRDQVVRELDNLGRQLQEARERWNSVASFLRAQGLKPDAMDMPEFQPLLPQVHLEETLVEVVEEDGVEWEGK